MDSALHLRARTRHPALLIATLAVPLTGWTVHAVTLHRRLAAARRDPLTGLLGRDGYTAKARQILTRYSDSDSALVVICDLDHFKEINDSRGHATGDAVLAATAQRLTAWAGNRAAVGRLGGDEFAVTLRIGPGRRELRLAHLVRMLSKPVILDNGQAVDVAASVGAASADVLGTTDLSQLQRAADASLYEGKHSGRAVLATVRHITVPSINGRRAGRDGTAGRGASNKSGEHQKAVDVYRRNLADYGQVVGSVHPLSCVGIPGFSRGGKRILGAEERSAVDLCVSA
ncbi:GGDEF domain-containing protein [Streptomyces sp. NBC_01717]|uniref:GGDEF domain-containing protein n=1 Tax=Streptomyces sp. NBC_01717 TaxID=2975918 RepID=UPI003FCEC902